MIQFACECGRQLRARESDAGQQAVCPLCQGKVVVPAGVAPPVEAGSFSPGQPAIIAEQPRSDDRPRRRGSYLPDGLPAFVRPLSKAAACSLLFGSVTFFSLALAILLALALSAWPALVFGLVAFVACIAAVVAGLVALDDLRRSKGRLRGWGTALAGLGIGCLFFLVFGLALLLPPVSRVREAGPSGYAKNNLKQMALAMHNHNDAYGSLPQATAYRDKDGKPLLSWRVALLPFIEQDNLFKQFKLDEPWDSPHNIKLLPRIPRTYLLADQTNTGAGLTHYQVLVGPDAYEDFPTGKPGFQLGLKIPGSFPDGTSNTILFVIAEQGVPWTKPDDLQYDPNGPLPRLSKRYPVGYIFGLADGGTRTVPFSISEQTLRNAITRSDGNVLGPDW